MSHSSTSRRGTIRRRRRAQPDRIAGGAQAAPQRAAHVDSLAVAVALGSPGAAYWRRDRASASSAGTAGRARRARARRSAWSGAPPRRWRASGTGLVVRAPRPTAGVAVPSSGSAPDGGAVALSGSPPLVRRCRLGRASSGAGRRVLASAPRRTRWRTRRRTPRTWVRSDTNAARAVQYSRRREIGSTTARACANQAARSAVTGTPASCSRRPNVAGHRRQVESERREPGTAAGRSSPAHQLLEPGGADHVLVLGVLEHRPERPVDRGRRPARRRRARSAPRPSRSPRRRPGGFCTSLSRIRDTASATCTASVCDDAAHAPADDLDLALRRSGSRSTGTGSGA